MNGCWYVVRNQIPHQDKSSIFVTIHPGSRPGTCHSHLMIIVRTTLVWFFCSLKDPCQTCLDGPHDVFRFPLIESVGIRFGEPARDVVEVAA